MIYLRHGILSPLFGRAAPPPPRTAAVTPESGSPVTDSGDDSPSAVAVAAAVVWLNNRGQNATQDEDNARRLFALCDCDDAVVVEAIHQARKLIDAEVLLGRAFSESA